MLSWILRHRSRLQVIYGLAEIPPLAGERFSANPRAQGSSAPESSGDRSRPGVLRRRPGGQIEVRPMPRRVA